MSNENDHDACNGRTFEEFIKCELASGILNQQAEQSRAVTGHTRIVLKANESTNALNCCLLEKNTRYSEENRKKSRTKTMGSDWILAT